MDVQILFIEQFQKKYFIFFSDKEPLQEFLFFECLVDFVHDLLSSDSCPLDYCTSNKYNLNNIEFVIRFCKKNQKILKNFKVRFKIQYQKNDYYQFIILSEQIQIQEDRSEQQMMDCHMSEEKQNYSVHEQIVAGIEEGRLISQIEQEYTQSNCSLELCSKHKTRRGEYFQSQHPWVKFCESCALNLALCGKRIQKSLSSTQIFTKITLCNTLQSICSTIKLSQKSHQQLSLASNQLQNSRQHFVSILSDIDKFISNLTQLKGQLQESINSSITQQIKQIFQRQSLIVGKKIEMINQKTKIQCGFMEMIGKENQAEKTKNVISQCKKLIWQAQQMMVGENYKIRLGQNVRKVQCLFDTKINQINSMQLKIDRRQFQVYTTAFGKKTGSDNKTLQTLSDESAIHDNDRKLTTACSTTLQNSGFVTPSEPHDMPLQQICQNRRSSRATLQLKARCRSKSGQKKIQVNVREEKQRRIRPF